MSDKSMQFCVNNLIFHSSIYFNLPYHLLLTNNKSQITKALIMLNFHTSKSNP